MTKDLYFAFEPGTTKLHESEVVLTPVRGEPEYSDGRAYTEVACKDDAEKPIYFARERWNNQSWFVVNVAQNGLNRIVCKVDDSIEPQPTEEEIARALLAEVCSNQNS